MTDERKRQLLQWTLDHPWSLGEETTVQELEELLADQLIDLDPETREPFLTSMGELELGFPETDDDGDIDDEDESADREGMPDYEAPAYQVDGPIKCFYCGNERVIGNDKTQVAALRPYVGAPVFGRWLSLAGLQGCD